ncbi:unnamed protein product [Phytophthora lilii]|uniref:Unnamed protein product n=1 Tax=Phytophthora lilii TaxID=2077276 RepID=A0A9W6U6B2_9STRA|nr:unnamed protein product [Phytophthora lilii]
MAASGSSAFKPVELSAYQAQKLETLMKQQVQDAILARSMQVAKDHKLDSNWRFVSSLGQLKTFKLSGADPCTSTSSWATTLDKTSRATAYSINGDDFGSTDRHTWSTRSTRSRWRNTPVSRLTVSSICGRRDPLDPQPPLQSFRTFGRVQGNYKDIVDVHYATNSADFVRKQKLLSSATLDAAVLRTIRATKDSYLGIKWIAENSFSGKRDICFVEMVGYTINTNGQEIGFVASASVDVPECPELSSGLKLSRVRRKSTMLFLPTADSPKVTSEVFVMGASEASEVLIMGNTQYRLNMAVLNDISLVIGVLLPRLLYGSKHSQMYELHY